MIISKTPYRVSFFGGGSDYPEWYLRNGGEVISSTINKFVYISVRNLPSFFAHKFRIVYGKTELVRSIDQIKHPAVKEAFLRYHKKKVGLELHYDGDLPARSGMGSSSVFVVGLINVLTRFNNIELNKNELANESIIFEQKYLKEIVGSQDQVAAAYGGFNSIVFKKDKSIIVKKLINNDYKLKELFSNFVLVYTGISRTANEVAKTYFKKLNSSKEKYLYKIIDHTQLAKKYLKNYDFDSFGNLLNETWEAKKKLSSIVTTPEIDKIYSLGKASGALGGKLLGAGGGGFILFYIKKNKLNKLRKKLSKFMIIPFDISKNGSEIIFNNE